MSRSYAASNALYQRALATIPLASQTFSKSAMNFVAGASPLFLDRGDGCSVWDVDGNRYFDYLLGLLPIVLGYRDPDVDAAIRTQLDKGIIFSLATELEPALAERLVRLIPCAEMVRYGKNGSDATSAAIRLARAHTGRDRVALCGYHGWHDWYIGTTTRDLGVPASVKGLSTTFPFNDTSALEAAFKEDPNGFAAVILEPAGTEDPAPGFLERLREVTARFGVVLIFDEIVTGFRMHMGGAQAKLGVVPDLACFGKAMANGMPIAAVMGRREIMRRLEDIFFSGTFGGEALSLAAAVATIDKLERTHTVEAIYAAGAHLKREIPAVLQRHGLSEHFYLKGPDWRPLVSTRAGKIPGPIVTSLLRQELAEQGILMGGAFNLCLAHDADALDATIAAFDVAAAAAAVTLRHPDPASQLRGRPIQPVFSVRKE